MSHVTTTNDEKSDQNIETLQESQQATTQIQVSTSAAPVSVTTAAGASNEESQIVIITSKGLGDHHESNPASKSSSTKSKKSKVSSTNSIENGYGKHHQLLQDRSSQSSTSIILNQPHPPNSWIEQIQFKAQYCHIRCNDYVTVINSARSLDKVEQLPFAQQLRAEQSKTKIIDQPSTSRQCSSPYDKGATTTSVSPKPPHSNPLFCWNFPRVKLPRLFNAKSLDDITNSQLQQQQRRALKHKDGRSQSSTSHEIHSVLNRTTVLKDNYNYLPQQPGPSHRIAEGQHPQTKGAKKARTSVEESCSSEANIGGSKLKPSSSSSSSENGATVFRTTRVIDGTGSTTTTTTTVEQQQRKAKGASGGGGQSRSKKHGSYFINCAKSDTCINNINRVHSSTPTITESGGGQYLSRLETIFIPCCSNPKIVYNRDTSKTTSVDNLDIVSNKPELKSAQENAESFSPTAPTSSAKKKISFLKPINKVNPIQTYTDDYEEVVDETTMELPNPSANSAAGVTVKPKLVVTSVSYLQRPMSPNPYASTSTTLSVTPGVLLRQNDEAPSPANALPSKNSKSWRKNRSTTEESAAGASSGGFSIKNYLGELIKEKCVTKRTETKHVERVREKVKDNKTDAKGCTKNAPTSTPSATATGAATKKPDARSIQSPLEVFYDKLETVEHFTTSELGPTGPNHRSRSSGTSSTLTSPESGTDDYKRAGPSNQNVNMSDLQSPQYVKKTANMFNSKMNSASSILHRATPTMTNTTGTSTTTLGDREPYYSSSYLLPVTSPDSKDGHVRHIAIERNGNGSEPSYLNVSKSVSGYHGLAYNSAEKSNGHLLNGSSGLKSPGAGANGVLRTQVNSPPTFTSPHKVSFMNDGHHTENGDLAPPLPKTGPPLSSPSLVNTNSSSSYKKVANSSSNVGNEFFEESSEKHHVISSQFERNYKPVIATKPAVPEKSRVLEQIQKLYGEREPTSNTPFRRHYSPQRTTDTGNSSTSTGKVTTIPIQYSNANASSSSGKENNTRNIVINKSQERIIPIAVDPYLQESTRAPPTMRNKTQDYQRYEKEERVYEGVNVKSSPGRHNLFEFEKFSNTNEVNFNTSPNSNTSSSKTDNMSKINGSNISQINIHRDNVDKNIHKTSITIPINVQNNGSSNGASSSIDNQTDKFRPMSSTSASNLQNNNDTVDTTSYSVKSVVTNSVSSAPKSSNVKIIPVQVQNDLENGRRQRQNSAKEANMDVKQQPIAKSLNKENDAPTGAVVKDGHFFLKEMANEKSRIEKLVASANEKLEGLDPSSDESGIVRAAIGKARLLINKKFKQFEELCQTNVKEQTQGTSGEPFTTQNDDLAGFWDMVLIQVDQIHQMFREFDPKYQKNAETGNASLYQRSALTPRKEVMKKVGSPTKSTPVKPKATVSSSTPNARDEMRKKMIEERRKAIRNAAGGTNGTTSEPDVQIFVPESQ